MKVFCILLCCMFGTTAFSQSSSDWFNASPADADSVYGAAVNKAYQYIAEKKLKVRKRPIVALIGSGIDLNQQDLQHARHADSWNFLGGKDGRVMDWVTNEGDREFLRLKDLYADYLCEGDTFYKIVNGRRQQVAPPQNRDEFNYYRYRIMPESELASLYSSWQFAYVTEEYVGRIDSLMRQHFPSKELTMNDFKDCYNELAQADSLMNAVLTVVSYAFNVYHTDKWEPVRKLLGNRSVSNAQQRYLNAMERRANDHRQEIVGDNPFDINDIRYGNRVLDTSDALSGVMQAGIIAAKRDNRTGIDGIAPQAQILSLRIDPGVGEPYLKDIAVAIRYAVNHGADIIVLSQQNSLYPEAQRVWVADALHEAEKRGVLVIVPVWELSRDIDKEIFYPNREMGGSVLTNLVTVAASDRKGLPVMAANYGSHALDIFAPGVDIRSTCTGDSCLTASGGGLAAATVAGVAALLKTYFPKLTGTQLRDILLQSVTSRRGVEVEKGIRINGRATQDWFYFEDLCASAGIVNACQAVLAAEEITRNGSVKTLSITPATPVTTVRPPNSLTEVLPFTVSDGQAIVSAVTGGETPDFSFALNNDSVLHPETLPSFLRTAVLTVNTERQQVTVTKPYRPSYIRLDGRMDFDAAAGRLSELLGKGIVSIDYPHRKVYFQTFDRTLIPKDEAQPAELIIKDGKLNVIDRRFFLEQIFDYRNGDSIYHGSLPVVIDFWATWCGPCMRMMPQMEQMAERYKGKVLFYKINADREKDLCKELNIQLLPTLYFIPADGKPIIETGALPEKYEQIIEEQLLK